MTADITIAPERADHPQVKALLASLDAYLGGLYAPDENHILPVEALLRPDVIFLAARQGDQLVGCGAARRMPAEANSGMPAYGEIKRMFVDPAARGQHIGARLLSALEEALRDEGIEIAALETGRDQAEAIRLYEHAGYLLRPPFGGYPDNGLSLFYAKALRP